MRTMRKNGKVTEALGLLTEAAKEKRDRFNDLVSEKAQDFKERLTDQANHGLEILLVTQKRLGRALRDEEKMIRRKAKDIGKKVHLNPWPLMGITALSAFTFGIFLHRKLTKSMLSKSAQAGTTKEKKERDSVGEQNKTMQNQRES